MGKLKLKNIKKTTNKTIEELYKNYLEYLKKFDVKIPTIDLEKKKSM